MKTLQFPYCKFVILNPNTAEVTVNEGVLMDENKTNHYHELLRTHLKAPFFVLINKKNSYTYDFDSQRKLGAICEIDSIAVVSYDRIAIMNTQLLQQIPRKQKWNMKIFSDKTEAVNWLESNREKKLKLSNAG